MSASGRKSWYPARSWSWARTWTLSYAPFDRFGSWRLEAQCLEQPELRFWAEVWWGGLNYLIHTIDISQYDCGRVNVEDVVFVIFRGRFVVVESMGIFVPSRDLEFDAKWAAAYCERWGIFVNFWFFIKSTIKIITTCSLNPFPLPMRQ